MMRRPGLAEILAWARVPSGDLWHDRAYLRLWVSILSASFGAQVMLLALPLTAAVLLPQALPAGQVAAPTLNGGAHVR